MTHQHVQVADLPQVASALSSHIDSQGYERLIIVVDENTERHCLPLLTDGSGMPTLWHTAPVVVIPSGEAGKDIGTVTTLWTKLTALGATRRTALVALGGGALTDVVGFVAATYKRGIGLINLPTTLLGAIDASIGGKTGIDLEGVKNIVGAFYPASLTLICPAFFDTLPTAELLSGYGEVLKYGLLCGAPLYGQSLSQNAGRISSEMLLACIEHKQKIVAEDPFDTGIRMTLNLGHTVAHALEALMVRRSRPQVPHGIAVTVGLITDLYLSVRRHDLDRNTLYSFSNYVREEFPHVRFTCHDYDDLIDIMRHDKKNSGDLITTILLTKPGEPLITRDITRQEMESALDFYRDFVGV